MINAQSFIKEYVNADDARHLFLAHVISIRLITMQNLS